MLVKGKFNSIVTLISQALIDMKEISDEEFVTILNEKDRYEKMNYNWRSENEKYKIMNLSSIKSKIKKKLTNDVTCLKDNSCKQRIKTRWILIAWSVRKILKILTQKCLKQKIIHHLCNQNVLFAESKSQDLLKNKKQKVYYVI